jgi:arabinofuranosyltransferase
VFCILALFPKWTVDDTYITFRYAHNLAHHGVLTWNVGEKPVEGYTGVLLPVILAGAIKAGLSPVMVTHLIGVMAFFWGGIVLFLLMDRLVISAVVRKVILLLYFTSPYLFTHAFSGLETTLFATAILTSLYLGTLCLENQQQPVLMGLLLLTGLIRPEGVVLAASVILVLGIMRARQRQLLRFGGWVLIGYVVPGLIYLAWKVHYYGELLPNTYYAKVHSGGFNTASLDALADFASKSLLFPLLVALALLLLDPARSWHNLKGRLVLPRLALVGAAGGVFVLVVFVFYALSELIMNFSHRFFMPFFPLLLVFLAVLFDLGAANLAHVRSQPHARYRRLRLSFAVLALALILPKPALEYPLALVGQMRFTRDMKNLLSHEHIPAGQFIAAHLPESEWLIVHDDAGAIPYYAGLKTVDYGRINDRYLARHTLSDQEIADYFYGYNAGVAVFTSTDWENLVRPKADAIIRDARFGRYTLAQKFRTPGYEDYYEFVYLRNDLFEQLELSR